jgi:nicotinate-nucleotide adenylyltransferase
MQRIAYFGGSFDPVHNGHLQIARALVPLFSLDRFYLLPAFHAPHKPDRPPTSAFHRFAMLSLASLTDEKVCVSAHELEKREKRYTIETLPELHAMHPNDRVFFVMGADSWMEIRTWKDWEKVLLFSDHIVVTRPGFDLSFEHVTGEIRDRIVDVRDLAQVDLLEHPGSSIFITDAVKYNMSATELRRDLADGHLENADDIPAEVANYIEKYELYR